MRGRAALVLGVACFVGCTCGRAGRVETGGPDAARGDGTRGEAGLGTGARASGSVAAPWGPSFGAASVAGAVVGAGALRGGDAVEVARFDGERIVWRAQILAGVAGEQGAPLVVTPIGHAVAVFFRSHAAIVGLDGHVQVDAIQTGSRACAIAGALVWLEAAPKRDTQVRLRAPEGDARTIGEIAADRELELVCGARRAFVVARGDDDVEVHPIEVAGAGGVERVPGIDGDEREHATFVEGDTLGLVRIGSDGALAWREDGAWRHSAARFARDEELVAVEATPAAFVAVAAREGGGARAVWIERAGGKASSVDLQGAREPDAFVAMRDGEDVVVAWADDGAIAAKVLRRGALVEAVRVPGRGPFAEVGCADGACLALTVEDGAPRVARLVRTRR